MEGESSPLFDYKIEDTSHSFIRSLSTCGNNLYENARRWLDRWLDESGWCAQPPQISTLSERAYDFEPRTLHHEKTRRF